MTDIDRDVYEPWRCAPGVGYRSVVGTIVVAGGEMWGVAAALMLTDEASARPGFLQRVIDCTDRVDTGPAPGPDRAQLLELAS